MKKDEHAFLKDLQKEAEGFDFAVDAHSLLIDLKVLLKEYYAGTFTEDGNALKIAFNNGQKFVLHLTEIKK